MAARRSDPPAPQASGDGLPRLGLILLATVTLFWGLSWVAMKVVLNEMTPWMFRAITVPVAGIILLALTRLSGLPVRVPAGRWPALIGVSMLNMAGWHVFSALGVSNLPAGRAALIAYTMPVWAALASVWLLRDPPTPRLWFALGLGMSGVAVLMGPDIAVFGDALAGVGYMLAAALSWGVGVVLLKRVRWEMPTLSLAAWQLLVAAVPIVPLALLIDDWHLPALSGPAFATLVFVIIVPICFCSWAFFKVVSLFPASVSAIGTLMIPVIGVVSGGLILGEPIGWRELVAMFLIGSALGLTLFFPARR